VRPAERGKEVVERVHVRDVDGGELQAPFVAVTAEEVAITDTSKRCLAAIRAGFLSSLWVPGAGVEIRVDPYLEGEHVVRGLLKVARTLPQKRPAWNC
jgi:hypothetical protein